MSEIEKLIDEEARASEERGDAPITTGARLSRPNRARSTVYSVRLSPDEVAAVQTLAEAADVPASTLVRSWIVERLREERGDLGNAEAELHAVRQHLAHLERHLARDAS